MKKTRRLWRSLLFVFLITALCGNFALPVVNVSAARPMQSSLTCNLMMAQWTFDNPPLSNTAPNPSTANVIASASENSLTALGFQATGANSGNAWSGSSWSQNPTPGPYFEFDVSTVGYTGISMSFWDSRSNTGPQNILVRYSTDGTNFADFNTFAVSTSVVQTSIDLSSITALENNASAKFRIYGINATGNGSLRIDDVTFTGCQPITPTPTSTPTATNTPTDTPTPTITPTPTGLRSVIINEVAWAGTVASSADEWFELYNTTGSDINLAGWHLTADDGNPDIALSGTIAAGKYFVFAKNSLVFKNLTPDKIYSSGSFSNTGEILYLLDSSGNQVDTANQDGGPWPAGSGSPTYKTIERKGNVADSPTAWATYGGPGSTVQDRLGNPINGTPGEGNWVVNVTPSPTATVTPTATATGTATGQLSVVINEVAWSGTAASSNDEWIELRNPRSSPIDITGWHLYGDDNTFNKVGTPNITLSGIIPAGGYFLLERDQLATDVAADQVYTTGELLNSGERLYLKDKSGNVIDTANLDGGPWPAGTATTTSTTVPSYASMERVGTTVQWVTYGGTVPVAHDRSGNAIKGTPGKANWSSTTSITTITFDSPDPSLVNQNVTVSVTVIGGNSTPTGTVTITGANTNCTLTLSTSGTGSCLVKFTSIGSKTLTATYNGDGGHPASFDTEPHTVSTSTTFRTPTPIPAPPPQLIAINEFVPRPGHDWNHDGVVNVGDEYIELLNHGTVDVNLSGWRLDDEVNTGSAPYSLPAKVLKPGERVVFYGSETGLLLSDGGDAVRLLKPNGQLLDAYNYSVASYPDQSFCRLPDNGGADDWNQNCYPTPGLQNSLSGNGVTPVKGVTQETLCPIADTLPYDFVWAECEPFGNNIFRRSFWDQTGWYGDKPLPIDSKWPIFAD